MDHVALSSSRTTHCASLDVCIAKIENWFQMAEEDTILRRLPVVGRPLIRSEIEPTCRPILGHLPV